MDTTNKRTFFHNGWKEQILDVLPDTKRLAGHGLFMRSQQGKSVLSRLKTRSWKQNTMVPFTDQQQNTFVHIWRLLNFKTSCWTISSLCHKANAKLRSRTKTPALNVLGFWPVFPQEESQQHQKSLHTTLSQEKENKLFWQTCVPLCRIQHFMAGKKSLWCSCVFLLHLCCVHAARLDTVHHNSTCFDCLSILASNYRGFCLHLGWFSVVQFHFQSDGPNSEFWSRGPDSKICKFSPQMPQSHVSHTGARTSSSQGYGKHYSPGTGS